MKPAACPVFYRKSVIGLCGEAPEKFLVFIYITKTCRRNPGRKFQNDPRVPAWRELSKIEKAPFSLRKEATRPPRKAAQPGISRKSKPDFARRPPGIDLQ